MQGMHQTDPEGTMGGMTGEIWERYRRDIGEMKGEMNHSKSL